MAQMKLISMDKCDLKNQKIS